MGGRERGKGRAHNVMCFLFIRAGELDERDQLDY